MAFFQKPRFWLLAGAVLVALLILQQAWHWEVERIEVPPGQFLIRIHKWGKNLPEGEIIAPDDSYKGIMLAVLPEGRHFLNPIFWDYQIDSMVSVPPGQCLVLTRKFGKDIPADRIAKGDILARENPANPIDGERGILRDVLSPGSYRLNKYAYTWETRPAIEIRIDQIGVRTLKVGQEPSGLPLDPKRGHYVVPDGYRGVQQTTVPPGTYYLNDYVEKISPVEVRAHRVELSDIQFPSRDGFILKPRVVVEYAVRPELAPEIMVRLADDGKLHQDDSTPEQQQMNEILQKVILPHIRGYARIQGSNFDARDFILSVAAATADAKPPTPTAKPPTPAAKPPTTGETASAVKAANAREAMQRSLLTKVKPKCEELGVQIRAVTLADLLPPKELSDQIALRELARVEREKNIVLVRQHKAQQELAAKTGLRQQAKEKVAAETRLVQGKTKSDQLKQVEESRLKQELANAQVQLDAARDQASATLAKGQAEAKVIMLKNEAEVAGLKTAVAGFSSADYFAQFHMLEKLAPALTEIFASDDSEFAKLFAQYMSQPGAAGKNEPARLETASGNPPPSANAGDPPAGPAANPR